MNDNDLAIPNRRGITSNPDPEAPDPSQFVEVTVTSASGNIDADAITEGLKRDRGILKSASLYVSTDDPIEVYRALSTLAHLVGYALEGQGEVERGSWFRRFRLRMRETEAPRKIAELADDVRRAAELQYIYGTRSQNDEREAQAVANLVAALASTDEAVIRLSSILLVKTGGSVYSQVLTEKQIRQLEANPALLKDPREILTQLSGTPRGEALQNPGEILRTAISETGQH